MHAEIKQELIFLDKEYQQVNDYFTEINELLQATGYVEKSFLEAIKTREINFPTGLPLNSCAIAIPHCDSEHIKQPFISFTKLRNTLSFVQMGTQDVYLAVNMIFMLGFTRDDPKQIVLLQRLMEIFMNEECVKKLLHVNDEDSCYMILADYLKLSEEEF